MSVRLDPRLARSLSAGWACVFGSCWTGRARETERGRSQHVSFSVPALAIACAYVRSSQGRRSLCLPVRPMKLARSRPSVRRCRGWPRYGVSGHVLSEPGQYVRDMHGVDLRTIQLFTVTYSARDVCEKRKEKFSVDRYMDESKCSIDGSDLLSLPPKARAAAAGSPYLLLHRAIEKFQIAVSRGVNRPYSVSLFLSS